MAHLYITDNGSVIGVEGGRFVIHQKKNLIKSIPKESVESISIFGNSTMTTPCMQEILISNIPVCFFSGKGRYYGRLVSTSGDKVTLLKQQFKSTEDKEFTIRFAQKIISAKIHNKQVVLFRYLGPQKGDCLQDLSAISVMERKVGLSREAAEIMGHEGYASRTYFKLLNRVIRPEFHFYGRNRRPPKDPFNAMLSLGYTLLLYEIMAKIEKIGLNAYCGVLHYDRDGSPALAEDLMEEWRAVIVDSLVMSMIQGNEVNYCERK